MQQIEDFVEVRRNRNAKFSEIDRCSANKAVTNKQTKFVVNAFLDWQPVQRGTNVVTKEVSLQPLILQ